MKINTDKAIKRGLTKSEALRRDVAIYGLECFMEEAGITEYECKEFDHADKGAIIMGTPRLDWGINSRVAGVSYEYD